MRIEVAGIGLVLVASGPWSGLHTVAESSAQPVSGCETFGEDYLEYTVEPATVGSNQVHLYLFDTETAARSIRRR